MKRNIIKLINTLHFIVNKKNLGKTFRYAICGGSNLTFDSTLYFICFHYILNKQNINLILFKVKISYFVQNLNFNYQMNWYHYHLW